EVLVDVGKEKPYELFFMMGCEFLYVDMPAVEACAVALAGEAGKADIGIHKTQFLQFLFPVIVYKLPPVHVLGFEASIFVEHSFLNVFRQFVYFICDIFRKFVSRIITYFFFDNYHSASSSTSGCPYCPTPIGYRHGCLPAI